MSARIKTLPPFTPTPHANAEVHKKIMADLKRMTAHQVFQTSVRAGIHTEDGRLTAPYRDDSGET